MASPTSGDDGFFWRSGPETRRQASGVRRTVVRMNALPGRAGRHEARLLLRVPAAPLTAMQPRRGWTMSPSWKYIYRFPTASEIPICQKARPARALVTFCEVSPSVCLQICKDARKIGGQSEEGSSSVRRTAFLASKNGLLRSQEGRLHIARRPLLRFVSE